jgi:4-hydroxybenzoate polyprenyltransferase
MKQLAAAFIYSNTWVALSLSCLLFGLCSHFQLEHTLLYTIFGFTSTITAYQLHRLFRLKELHTEETDNSRLSWMKTHKQAQMRWFLLCITATAIFTLMIQWNRLAFVLLFLNSIIVLLYALPIKQLGNGFRNVPFFKNLFISSSWVLVLALPFLLENRTVPLSLLLLMGGLVFLYILPFDIRDLPYDGKHMRTLPQLLGAEKVKIIGVSMIVCCLLILIESIEFHWILLLILFITFIGFYLPNKSKNALFLEFIWELPLFLMGWYFLLLQ